MVWIQGHNFTFGSSAHYPAHILASLNDVIVVTFNYRLGILGFLNIPGTDLKGNYGMQDQVYGSNRAVTHCKMYCKEDSDIIQNTYQLNYKLYAEKIKKINLTLFFLRRKLQDPFFLSKT